MGNNKCTLATLPTTGNAESTLTCTDINLGVIGGVLLNALLVVWGSQRQAMNKRSIPLSAFIVKLRGVVG